jgi:hypothetical protein
MGSGEQRLLRSERENPLERLRLLGDDDAAIAAFLDEIDIHSPRERELLRELARTAPLARADRFGADHRRAVAALESLRRHGFHGSRAAARLGPAKTVVRWLIELVARYIVVSYVRSVALNLRNLYWFREVESEPSSQEHRLLRRARLDAAALAEITKSRTVGIPTFVIGGLLVPIAATVYRAGAGIATRHWLNAVAVGFVGALIGVGISWVILRGTAMASRRIRLAARGPVAEVWASVGSCGEPPRDQSRTFAIVAITLTVGAWVVVPVLVGLALAT